MRRFSISTPDARPGVSPLRTRRASEAPGQLWPVRGRRPTSTWPMSWRSGWQNWILYKRWRSLSHNLRLRQILNNYIAYVALSNECILGWLHWCQWSDKGWDGGAQTGCYTWYQGRWVSICLVRLCLPSRPSMAWCPGLRRQSWGTLGWPSGPGTAGTW